MTFVKSQENHEKLKKVVKINEILRSSRKYKESHEILRNLEKVIKEKDNESNENLRKY